MSRHVDIRSAAVYAFAFWATKELHEVAHALTGLALGRGPILHSDFVDYARDGSVTAQIVCKAAGPLVSLAQGAVLTLVVRRAKLSPHVRLVMTWLAYHGLVNFVGYVFSTAFAPTADLGGIAVLLELPWYARVAVTVLGYLGLRRLVFPLADSFASLATPEQRSTGARAVGLYAGLAATPALVLSALPVPHWLSLVYVVTAPLPLFDLGAKARTSKVSDERPLPAEQLGTTAPWIALCVVLVAVVRLALDAGVTLSES